MRVLKFALAVGLILAVSGTAGALTIPSLAAGVNAFGSSNFEIGTSYTATIDGTYNKVAGVWVGPVGGVVSVFAPPSLVGTEEGYGVLFIDQLFTGSFGGNTVTPDVMYWQEPLGAVAGTRLMGYFWGGEDYKLEFSTVAGVQSFTAYQAGTAGFRLFAVDLTAAQGGAQKVAKQLDVAASHQGNPPLATAVFIDGPPGGDWPGDTVNDVLLLEGIATSTVFRQNGLAGTQALGDTTNFLSVDPTKGLWGALLDSDIFTSEVGTPADIRIDWVIEAPVVYGSTDIGAGFIRSSDEGGFHAIPEPMTMLGVFLGISGLGGYIRRRMAA